MLYCHRTVVKKVWFSHLTPANFQTLPLSRRGLEKAADFMQRCFSSSTQADIVDKGSSSPPKSLLMSPLIYVPPSVGVDESESLADHNDYFHFFSPADQTKIRVAKKQYIPGQKGILTPDDAICVGSSHGWLAFVNPTSCNPYLFNPLIQSSSHLPYVPLPPYETLRHVRCLRSHKSDHLSPSPSLVKDFMLLDLSATVHSDRTNRFAEKKSKRFIEKVAISSAPSLPRSLSPQKCDEDCTVVILDGDQTYFCKLGDERWRILDDDGYYDIMYFSKDQRFYAMCSPDHIEAWDLKDSSCPKRAIINPSSSPMGLQTTKDFLNSIQFYRYLTYLVESTGDLLLVLRFCTMDCAENDNHDDHDSPKEVFIYENYVSTFYWSSRFDVYKLNFDQNKWEHVECIGDRALFVGRNHSFSVSTKDHPELSENSIYFTVNYQDSEHMGYDSGIFHLKDKSITQYDPLTWKNGKQRILRVEKPQPVWVAPNKL